jgi:hypothetical protein
MRRITEAMTLLEEGAGGNELPKMEAGESNRAATQQFRSDIVPRLAELVPSALLLSMSASSPVVAATSTSSAAYSQCGRTRFQGRLTPGAG